MSELVIDKKNCELVISTSSYGEEPPPYLVIEKTILAETPLVSLKNVGEKKIKVATFTATVEGTKPVQIRIYLDALFGGTFNLHPKCDCTAIALDGALNYTVDNTTGTEIRLEQNWGTSLAKEDSRRLDLLDTDIPIVILPGEIVTFTAESANSSEILLDLRFKAQEN